MGWLLFIQILITMLVCGLVASFVVSMYFTSKDRSFGNRIGAFGEVLKNTMNDISSKQAENTNKAMQELINVLKNKKE